MWYDYVNPFYLKLFGEIINMAHIRLFIFIVVVLLVLIVLVSGTDFSGFSLGTLWFYIRVFIGVAIMIGASVAGLYTFSKLGRNLISGAVTGLVVGSLLFAIAQIVWRALFSTP